MVKTQSEYVIETVSLTKIFPDWWGRAKVVAVDDLNLKIRSNEIYGFLGPNGSGKTTTIKMLLNLLHPTRGAAFVFGGKVDQKQVSSRIGYLPEDSYLYPYLTARETLEFYGRIFALPADIRKERIETLLEMVGLSGLENRQVGTFSKGMARRIGLAQALINDPDLLILDEPTSGMDPIGTRQMKDLFVELAQRGKTVLLCSHLLADVEDICDRIGILYGGKMQVQGTVRDLLRQKDEVQIRAGRLSDAAVEKIQKIAADEGQAAEVENPMDKLESFFIKIVEQARRDKQTTSGAGAGTGILGFLADKPVVRQQTILDELVTAKVDQPAGRLTSTTQTTQPESPQPAASENKGLLDALSAKTVEKTAVTKNDSESAAPGRKVSQDQVKKALLDKLTGREPSGLTEPTQQDSPEDSKDA